MRTLFILLFFSCSVYVAQGDDFFRVEQQNIAEKNARAQAEYNAQQAEQRRLEKISIEQHEADRRAREKAIQAQDAANKAAALRAQAAASKAEAAAKAANEERLQDKIRIQTQEDEERQYIKQQSALKIQQLELETQRLKAKADLESAIAKDRIKSVDADTAIARKKEATEIDVIQSGADVDRTVAKGVESNLSGTGNQEFYKFLAIISLVILVILLTVITWWYFMHKKSNTNVHLREESDDHPVNHEKT